MSRSDRVRKGPVKSFHPHAGCPALKDGRLEGELILEVPVQTKPVPQAILDEANKRGIIIRDITGKVYN